jgi:hypothetical protein
MLLQKKKVQNVCRSHEAKKKAAQFHETKIKINEYI